MHESWLDEGDCAQMAWQSGTAEEAGAPQVSAFARQIEKQSLAIGPSIELTSPVPASLMDDSMAPPSAWS